MQVIRRSMFETNSSSVHTAVVNPEETKSIPELVLGNFGWGPWRSNDPYVKASYLFTLDVYGSRLYDKFNKNRIRTDDEDTCTKNFIESLKRTRIYKKITKVFGKEIPIDSDQYHLESIHIDGESIDSAAGFLKKIGKNMSDFILDRTIYLVISNDNCYDSPEEDAAPIQILNVRGLLR